MNNKEQNRPAPGWRLSLLRNWLSLAGLIVAVGSLFSFLFVFVQDSVAHFTNPYIGILTYLVAPGFCFSAFLLPSSHARLARVDLWTSSQERTSCFRLSTTRWYETIELNFNP